MKRRNCRSRRGVVLLLILGLTAMFALSVLTFMVVTSNMADTAQNMAKLETFVETPASEEIGTALKGLLVGSNNENNPVGPFGILENMYGDSDLSFPARIELFPNRGFATVTPLENEYGDYLFPTDKDGNVQNGIDDAYARQEMMRLFEKSGGVLTFSTAYSFPNDSNDETKDDWDADVANSSAFVLEKVVTNPSASMYVSSQNNSNYWAEHYEDSGYSTSNVSAYDACDAWHFKVELNDDLKRFIADSLGGAPNNFNESRPVVDVRLNLAAYSGTGVGGFAPGEMKDAQLTPEMATALSADDGTTTVGGYSLEYRQLAPQLRIPYAFWANAAAPDVWPHKNASSNTTFKELWGYLKNENYLPYTTYFDENGNLQPGNFYVTGWGGSDWSGTGSVAENAPVRVNSAYTAPDSRSLFLARLTLNGSFLQPKSPSFHRPSTFQTLLTYGYFDAYDATYTEASGKGAGIGVNANAPLLTALVRKLTPRPLPLDHWNFTGGNPTTFGISAEPTVADVKSVANDLTGNSGATWDVDSDGDGVKEAVWVPSGLPIRVDKNGTPYATMYAYTVVDLDGRLNVNAAGNWDQLPNRYLGTSEPRRAIDINGNAIDYNDYAQPFNFVDEYDKLRLDSRTNVGTSDLPFSNADSLSKNAGEYGWRGDFDDDWSGAVAPRGLGFGTASVLLYEYLAAVLDPEHKPNVQSTESIEQVAATLLWRRNLLSTDSNVENEFVQGGNWSVVWDLNAKFGEGAQPGFIQNGSATDDSFRTKALFFDYYNPFNYADDSATIRIYPWRGKSRDVDGSANAVEDPFDFADSGFRTYDPLGQSVVTRAPTYARNPYAARLYAASWEDSPYSLAALERLLRPSDSDSGNLDARLVDDLLNSANLNLNDDIRAAVRNSATTISSDVPAPSLVFPENKPVGDGEISYGNLGIVDLIRRNVDAELTRIFKTKEIYVDVRGYWGTNGWEGDGINDYFQVFDDQTHTWSYRPCYTTYKNALESIVAYLTSLLPPEILAGQKFDLNALAQKNYWIDVDFDDNGNVVKAGTALHNVGLVKRMERARGLYVLITTLLYEDMNAGTLYGSGAPEEKLNDYVEGSFDLSDFKDDKGNRDELGYEKDSEQALVARELIATRIAQWCANVVDFSDPDATMTPFFFDPTPFDGWWVANDWIDAGKVEQDQDDGTGTGATKKVVVGWDGDVDPRFLFDSQQGIWLGDNVASEALNGTPAEAISKYFVDAFDSAESSADATKTTAIAKWLNRQIAGNKIGDQAGDLGFRLVWGMERPDLLLTETLSFHDLGVADTYLETTSATGASRTRKGVKANGTDPNNPDPTFDQVKRPEGSTYLELYCAANPNVPQSPELYDFDGSTWKLALAKVTPGFKDSRGETVKMPVWRVAISESADPRGVNAKEKGKTEPKKTKEGVYNNAYNSPLTRLCPDEKEFSLFSMQTKQFRNLPIPTATDVSKIANIASLDLLQGFEDEDNEETGAKKGDAKQLTDTSLFVADWKEFNMRSSCLLGPAFAAARHKDDYYAREIELDRIVYFNSKEKVEDNVTVPLRQMPDSVRSFYRAEYSDSQQKNPVVECNLAPNEYLVLGPALKREIGSRPYNAGTTNEGASKQGDSDKKLFDVAPTGDGSFIDLTNLDGLGVKSPKRYKYAVAESIMGDRGLNISEPLWTNRKIDPYYSESDQNNKIDPTVDPANNSTTGVRDVPFEMPKDWGTRDDKTGFYENYVSNYPIVKDKLFGIGTVPAYKTAFVQRVADPNRPYHPLLNPYLTVDWNAMDLTVFSGESVEYDADAEKTTLTDSDAYPFKDSKNVITLAKNKAVGLDKDDEKENKIAYTSAFSSRQWGNAEQKAFGSTVEQSADKETDKSALRPNPWARAVAPEDGERGGLQKPKKLEAGDLVMTNVPQHTLGFYNNRGKWGTWADVADASGNLTPTFTADETNGVGYRNLNSEFTTQANAATGTVYVGSPRVPFENLTWNDAPYSNPMEPTLVPASAPGRFGLEFVRTEKNEDLDVAKLYAASESKDKKGTSLGFDGVFGFDRWYDKIDDKDEKRKDLKDKVGKTGPYLNFFASSNEPGRTLNLCKALEFVYVPSRYLGTKKLAGQTRDLNGGLNWNADGTPNIITDDAGNPVWIDARREPGKVNINTTTKPVWKALSPSSERVEQNSRLPGTPWDESEFNNEFNNGGQSAPVVSLTESRKIFADDSLCPFLPAHTTGLWAQLDNSAAPIPTFTTLLAGCETDLYSDPGSKAAPLFDNLGVGLSAQKTNAEGELMFRKIASGHEVTASQMQEEIDASLADEDENNDLSKDDYEPARNDAARNNLWEATAEMQRLSGLTTNRSNAFAIWVTVGYFEVERCDPGFNMPAYDPDGNRLTVARLTDPGDKWYKYYQAIYPDGYTYGKELGSEFGETKRRRGFAIVDRSIPVDFRRGDSRNYQNAILLKRVLD